MYDVLNDSKIEAKTTHTLTLTAEEFQFVMAAVHHHTNTLTNLALTNTERSDEFNHAADVLVRVRLANA